MKCPHCNWQNAASFTHCFNCNAPLAAPPPAQAGQAGPDAQAPARADPALAARAAPRRFNRVLAALLDLGTLGLLLVAANLLLALGYRLASVNMPGLTADTWLLAALTLAVLLLLALSWQDTRRGTFGKRQLDLRVLHIPRHGPPRPPGLLRASLRQTLRLMLHISMPVVLALFERPLLGPQGLHNLLTRCRVVRASASDEAVRHYLQHERERPARNLAICVRKARACWQWRR